MCTSIAYRLFRLENSVALAQTHAFHGPGPCEKCVNQIIQVFDLCSMIFKSVLSKSI